MEELRTAMNIGIHGAVYVSAIQRALESREQFRPELFGSYVGAITIDWYEKAGRGVFGDVHQIRIAPELDLTYDIATPVNGQPQIYIDLDMIRGAVSAQCSVIGIDLDTFTARQISEWAKQ